MDYIDIARSFDLSYGMIDILAGKHLGTGCSRQVYTCNIIPNSVIKFEYESTNCNLKEFLFWRAVKDQPDKSRWLAPCLWISDNGRVLIQRRTRPITRRNKKDIPANIPKWLMDVKESNFGFIGKQLVSHDYAFSIDFSASNVRQCFKAWKEHNF